MTDVIAMTRHELSRSGRRLSYLDPGGPGQPLVALHGHFAEGRAFVRLAAALSPHWRVIAPDQRGHGESDRADDYTRAGYLDDLAALLDHLGLATTALLGHSLGGVNAYQFAAREPGRVTALVVEDIGAVVAADRSFAARLPTLAPDRDALAAAIGPAARYLADAMRERPDGWGLAFTPADTVRSQEELDGDHWADWLASPCPALLIRGTDSTELSAPHAAEMVRRRPGTTYAVLPGGHVVHDDSPDQFAAAVAAFLNTVVLNTVVGQGRRKDG
jgi:esterase